MGSKEITKDVPELGPLAQMLDQDNVEDIYIIGPRRVVVALDDGRQFLSDIEFASREVLVNMIGRILAREGKKISNRSPFADACLSDGSRVHIASFPAADPWPQIVIRRNRQLFGVDQDRLLRLIQLGTISAQAALLLSYAVKAGASILVAGATAAGKSTFISALGGVLDPLCPIVSVEDTRELDFPGINVSYLVASPPDPDGRGGVSQQFLVAQALRKAPRWIVLGEARGAEAWGFLQAGNTGHGILASVHANSARDALERYKDLCLEVGSNMEESVVMASVLRAFRLVVFLERCPNSMQRVVRHIVDVTGNINDRKIPVVQDLFIWHDGQLRCTKQRPYPRLETLLTNAGCNYLNIVQRNDIPAAWLQAERQVAAATGRLDGQR